MSTGTYARVRSALAVNPVLLVFVAIYVSIVALSFAAVWTTEYRLPAEVGNLTSYWLESEVIAMAMYLAWVALPRPHRMRYALETVMPIGLCLYGVDAGGLTATLWFNLDAKTFQMPFDSLPGIGVELQANGLDLATAAVADGQWQLAVGEKLALTHLVDQAEGRLRRNKRAEKEVVPVDEAEALIGDRIL